MTTHTDQHSKMSDSLSAMFDDEANEEDLQRLLAEESIEEELRAFHLIQQSLHKEPAMALDFNQSLVKGVREQIALEEPSLTSAHNTTFAGSNEGHPHVVPLTQRIRSFWPSVAMAASVAFVVILGGDFFMSPNSDISTNQVAQQELNIEASQPITPLAELNKQPLKMDNVRLQNYLRQHAEQATMNAGQGMIPMARLASYPTEE